MREEHEPNGIEALYWNTGPAMNWLATFVNEGPSAQHSLLSQDAHVLAIEIAGETASMELEIASNVTLTARNGMRISPNGMVTLDGGTLNTVREIDIRPGGALRGSGLITGEQFLLAGVPEFENQGLLEPEVINGGLLDPIGTLAIEGDFVQRLSGILDIELGTDQLVVTGSAKLQGGLHIHTDLALTAGDVFEVLIAGALDVSSLYLSSNSPEHFELFTNDNSLFVRYVDADFNQDGIIDGADLVAWEAAFGSGDGADANADGIVDGFDFLAWQRQYGMTSPANSTAVPEPSSLVLLLASLLALPRFRRG